MALTLSWSAPWRIVSQSRQAFCFGERYLKTWIPSSESAEKPHFGVQKRILQHEHYLQAVQKKYLLEWAHLE